VENAVNAVSVIQLAKSAKTLSRSFAVKTISSFIESETGSFMQTILRSAAQFNISLIFVEKRTFVFTTSALS
jgi:hypothetical protein